MIANQIAGALGAGAGGGGGSFESIATAVGTGSSDTITLSSIPSTYKHLQLRILGRSSYSGNTSIVETFVNNDLNQSYAYHRLAGDGSSANAGGVGNTYSIQNLLTATAASAAANTFAVATIDIHDYSDTTKNKTIRSFHGHDLNGSGNVYLTSALWRSTSAITSLSFVTQGNWTSTTTFALYGIKG